MAVTALRLIGATKLYDRTVALDGLDLVVEEGRFFVLFGPSSVGKTTTLAHHCRARPRRPRAASICSAAT